MISGYRTKVQTPTICISSTDIRMQGRGSETEMFSSQLLMRIICSLLFVVFCFTTPFASAAGVLPADEVQALQEVGQTLGKTDWDFSVDPCSGQKGWGTIGSENAVTCNCTYSNNTVCHVTSIALKSQNLQGSLPPQLINLPYLIEIDLTRNYLNGTIPPEWGSLNLVNISLLANRLTGPIPKEFGNITTLKSLVLEFNQLSGVLPPELGNLPQIQRLFLTSNYFTGEIPATFAKLTSLKDLRFGDNQFTGKIPNFIGNWTNLEKLIIQGSGLQGPIPPEILSLQNLLDLRISDLNGTAQPIPKLFINLSMKTLILRSCNLTGPIPDNILKLTGLKTLDLSFNNLTGPIPRNFYSLSTLNYLYLTGNSLTGQVPDWIFDTQKYIDLSYNNFTIASLPCQDKTVNLFESSPKTNNSALVSCLGNLQCPRNFYRIHINCGGGGVTVGNTSYDDDSNRDGPANYFTKSDSNWAYSSTGAFMDDEPPLSTYTWSNSSSLSVEDPRLYTTARFSPLSLTYYGFCLMNGSYTVDLHFAEIVFTADRSYNSLGRRIFDVYLQGKRVLKDFDIAAEAGGNGKAIVKNFTASVTDGTLEIRFFWAGKGTVSIPKKGDYGPLISAISVTPNFDTPKEPGKGISVGLVAGITVAGVLAVVLIAGIIWWKTCRRTNTMDEDLKGLDLQTGSFTLRQLKAATKNFDAANKIGEGGFGSVYKGRLSDGTIIAVKQLSSRSRQGNREFINEIGMISALQHPHLVKLYGCCIEGNQLLLVYEYMENNSLARALFGPEEFQLNMDWPTRRRICVGIARGLAFLHEESRLKIVHRDIKATNVLLDKDLVPKISDFGLAKLDEEDNTHISTRIAGTYGYMAPEYAMRGHLTDKADVYSFGIVVLEVVSGRSNTSYRGKEESFYLLDWAHILNERGNLMDLIDPRLGIDYDEAEVMVAINVALLCTSASPTVRPAMSSVMSMLEGNLVVPSPAGPSNPMDDATYKAMMSHFQNSKVKKVGETQTQSMSMDGPFTAASFSAGDLYPIDLDSSYWHGRD